MYVILHKPRVLAHPQATGQSCAYSLSEEQGIRELIHSLLVLYNNTVRLNTISALAKKCTLGLAHKSHASYTCTDMLRVRHALLSTGPLQAIASLLGTDTCSRILPDNAIHKAMTLVPPREEKSSGPPCPELCDWTGTLLYSVTEPVSECAGEAKHMLAAKCVKSMNSAHSDNRHRRHTH